jgi:hypothetical protein
MKEGMLVLVLIISGVGTLWFLLRGNGKINKLDGDRD